MKPQLLTIRMQRAWRDVARHLSKPAICVAFHGHVGVAHRWRSLLRLTDFFSQELLRFLPGFRRELAPFSPSVAVVDGPCPILPLPDFRHVSASYAVAEVG